MSQSIIEKLLKGAEVEWKTLGTLFQTITTGKLNANAMVENGAYPFFTCNEKPHRINQFSFDMEAIIIAGNGNVGQLNYYKGKFDAYQRTYIVGNIDTISCIKYVYYFLKSQLRSYVLKNSKKGSIPYITLPMLQNFSVPIPPLSVQKEILGILDAFTAHTAELTAELNERKKQYNYYRDKLLTFSDDEVEWKTLGEVCKFKNGFAFKSSLFKEVGDPIVRITNIDGKIVNTDDVKYFQMKDYKEDLTSYTVNKGDIIIAMSGATTGKIGLYNYEYTSYLNQRVGKFIPKQKILNNKYLYYYLQLKINDIFAIAGGGAQPNLSSNKLMEKFKIPIPPLSVQKEIVRILDSFWTLTTSISEGLPREIELRNKQYEYYRDQLLNFPKPENDAIKHNSTNR